MKKIKKFSVFILSIMVILIFAQFADCKQIKKDVEFHTKDSRIIKAKIIYEQSASQKQLPTVLLLHSIGYSSEDWGGLIATLNKAGFAVIAMDLRGHGQSVYDTNFHKKSWPYFTNKTYQKFPSDVLGILSQTQQQVKNLNLKNMAIVGADLGANSAVLAAVKMKIKPKTMVLISPLVTFKGLYIPVVLTNLNMPILTMTSKKDRISLASQKTLAKFSQGGFYAQNYPNGGMGMLMIKVNPSMASDITKWISKYLK